MQFKMFSNKDSFCHELFFDKRKLIFIAEFLLIETKND
jgi:hypothetical protein